MDFKQVSAEILKKPVVALMQIDSYRTEQKPTF